MMMVNFINLLSCPCTRNFDRVEGRRTWWWNAEGMMLPECVMLIMLMGRLVREWIFSFGSLMYFLGILNPSIVSSASPSLFL